MNDNFKDLDRFKVKAEDTFNKEHEATQDIKTKIYKNKDFIKDSIWFYFFIFIKLYIAYKIIQVLLLLIIPMTFCSFYDSYEQKNCKENITKIIF